MTVYSVDFSAIQHLWLNILIFRVFFFLIFYEVFVYQRLDLLILQESYTFRKIFFFCNKMMYLGQLILLRIVFA